ncbi:hypothetical protein CHU98_g9249 [Xylaria longipes]|nr:hypothetical protein CHU98_g9249 [Xylaria longipes]
MGGRIDSEFCTMLRPLIPARAVSGSTFLPSSCLSRATALGSFNLRNGFWEWHQNTRPRQVPSNARDADDSRGHIIASIVPCMVLAFTALMMRLASRRIRQSGFFVSDYLAIAGMLCAWVVSLSVIAQAGLGLGLHVEQVSPANVREIVLTEWIGLPFYAIGFTLIKLSIIALYRQLFPTRFMIFSTTLLAIFVILWGSALVLTDIFSCNPINGFWDIDVPSKCIDSKWFFVGNSIPNILADLFLLLLPMRDVWRLQLGRGSKIAVSGMFALGSFVTIVSGLRIGFTLAINRNDITLPEWLKKRLTSKSTQESTGQQAYNFQAPRTQRTLGSHVKITSLQHGDFIPL